MITVYAVTTYFCEQKKLPPPTRKDLGNIGKLVSMLFRNTLNKLPDLEIIKDAGFIRTKEQGRVMIVCFYPDSFTHGFLEIIEQFYKEKSERIRVSDASKKVVPEVKPVEKQKRKRVRTILAK